MKNDNLHIDDTLLARFLLGETNIQERDFVIDWIDQKKENRKYVDQLEAVWLESGKIKPQPIPVNKKIAWSSLSKRIDEYETNFSPNLKKYSRLRIVIYSSIAASILALIGIFNWYSNETAYSKQFVLENTTKESFMEVLPDGSEIYLNYSSNINYVLTENNQRVINLKGEAYFKVKRDTNKPFIVNAGIGGVKVLGTSFLVKLRENGDIAVDVSSGKVELFKPNKAQTDTLHLVLTKDEGGLISNQQDTIIRISSNSSAFFWVDKRLSFRNKQLKEIFKVLEACYNIEIKIEDPEVNDLYYTSTFIDNDAEEVIKVISETHNLSYTKEENVFTILVPQKNE